MENVYPALPSTADNSYDSLKRVFFYKRENECFKLADDGTLRITYCEIPQLNLVNPFLVPYGDFARKSEMKDLRKMDIQDVISHMKSFELGKFLCMEILSNTTTLFFDLPDMNVSSLCLFTDLLHKLSSRFARTLSVSLKKIAFVAKN